MTEVQEQVAEPVEADPAPQPVQPVSQPLESVAAEPAVERDPNSVSWWPFVAYVGIWALFSAALVWMLLQVPAGVAVFDAPAYRAVLAGGLALEFAGFALIGAVWFASWDQPGSTKFGLFVSAAIKGAVAMFVGTCLWWVALVVLDQLRLGSVI